MYRYYRLIVVVTFLLIPSLLLGQSILYTGKVIDQETNKAIPGAVVKVERNGLSALTNVMGFLQITADTADYLRISSPDFKTITFKAPPTTNFRVPLIKEDEAVFLIVEDPATPKRGLENYYKYISENFPCSPDSIENETGIIIVEFITTTDGSFQNISIIENNITIGCDSNIISMIANAPKWKPALQRGSRVKQKHSVTIEVENKSVTKVSISPAILPSSINSPSFYLLRNINTPLSFKERDSIKIYVYFEINNEKRTLEKISILNSTDEKLKKEIIRVFETMPFYVIQNFNNVTSKVIQPISFVINNQPTATFEHITLPNAEILEEITINSSKGN